MNTYEIHIKNAVITHKALNEWSALKDLCIFSAIGNMIDFVRTDADPSLNHAWIYQVELNGEMNLAYVKRVS